MKRVCTYDSALPIGRPYGVAREMALRRLEAGPGGPEPIRLGCPSRIGSGLEPSPADLTDRTAAEASGVL